MVTPDEARALPLGTRVRINTKGQFKTFFEGYTGEVVRIAPLYRPEQGFNCYVAIDDPEHIRPVVGCFISRDLDVLPASDDNQERGE